MFSIDSPTELLRAADDGEGETEGDRLGDDVGERVSVLGQSG